MINDHSVARPYAQAAFNHALQEDKLVDWDNSLELLSLMMQDKRLVSLLSNPKVSKKSVQDLIIELVNAPNQAINNFILLLAENKRLSLISLIYELFRQLKLCHEHVIDVHVLSAFDLNETQSKNLQAAIAAKYGQQIKLHIRRDDSLIGGLVVRIGDTVIDNSIRGKINRLKAHLSLKETACQ